MRLRFSEHQHPPQQEVKIKDVADHINEPIDLLNINIEGSEFAVLERLIETGKLDLIKEIQVQFHDFAPDAVRP